MKKIRYLDCFAGVGGFHLALEQSVGKENVECIGFSEIDKYAIQVYKEHFPKAKDLGSITELDIDKLEDFDLLTGGFPCQDVSVAGKQDLEGGRTILVEYLLQILEKKQPKYFVFENVKGLMSKKFDTFRESIFNRIRLAGYGLTYQVLNTKDFGLPQNRERVFIVGKLKGGYNFPLGKELTTFLKDILEEEVDEKYYLTDKNLKHLQREFGSKGQDITGKDIIGTLTASMGTGGGNVPYLQQFNNKRLNQTFQKVNTNDVVFLDSYNNKIYKDITPTITTRVSASNLSHISKDYKVRKLTPVECERLQGFPDSWTSLVSNSQAYKQMGNAISVPVVKAIFDNLFR